MCNLINLVLCVAIVGSESGLPASKQDGLQMKIPRKDGV
jgi:hypothetical protein